MDAPDRLLADLEKEVDDTGFAAKRGVDHIRAVKLGSNGVLFSLSLSLSPRFVMMLLYRDRTTDMLLRLFEFNRNVCIFLLDSFRFL